MSTTRRRAARPTKAEPPAPSNPQVGNSNTRHTYVYTDEHGSPLYRVVRRPGKRFHQERYLNGEWMRGLGDAPRVLYNLPAVLDAAERGGTVWICEGEKDADAIMAMGIPATTNPGGAGHNKWHDEYSRSLVGVKRAVVCWDNDPPDKKTGKLKGQDHALEVAASLERVGVPVRFMRALEGNDVSDHLEAGHPLSALVRERPVGSEPESAPVVAEGLRDASQTPEPAVYQLALRKLREYADEHGLPAPRPSSTGWECSCPSHDDRKASLGVRIGDDQPLVVKCQAGCELHEIAAALGIDRREFSAGFERPSKPRGNMRLYRPDDLAEEPRRPKALIRGVASEGSYGPFGGKEKTLKSICAFAGALALASGKPMLGYEPWSVPEARPALIFAGEGGYDLAHRRVQRIAKDIYGISDLRDVPLYVMEGVAEMNGEYFQSQTMEFVSTYGEPGLVVLDSLYNYHDAGVEVGNLYARGLMLSDFQHFIHRECGPCGLWVVDHFRKSASGTGLEEYQQSGMGPWADSWWNAQHRLEPDLNQKRFWLKVEVGSRHGYGGVYEIDVAEGPFDDDLMTWLEPMTARVRRPEIGTSAVEQADADRLQRVVDAVGNEPGIVKKKLEAKVGSRKSKAFVARAVADDLIRIEPGARGGQHHHLTKIGQRMHERKVSASGDDVG